MSRVPRSVRVHGDPGDGHQHNMLAELSRAAQEVEEQDRSQSPPDDGDAEDEHVEEEGHGLDGLPNKRPKRSRACQACRGMKIRCLPVEGQDACRACSKVNRQCVMPGPPRKRQKTVHKVAELERKIEALTASMAAKSQQNTLSEPTPPTDSPHATSSTPGNSSASRQYMGPLSNNERQFSLDVLKEAGLEGHANDDRLQAAKKGEAARLDQYVDVIARGIVSLQTANQIYDRWKKEMCPYSPFVAFDDSKSVQWLRKKRPMVLLVILGVGSGTICPEIQTDLMVEASRQIADRVMYYHEKSLDLAQAMMIYPSWYGKHKYAKDLGFSQYIHSAVVLSLDLGLGKRSRNPRLYSDEEDAERRRTWMGCYFLAGSVATVLRLPALVKFSPYLQECLDILPRSPVALPHDGFVCALVQHMHIFEDASLLFHMDDPGSAVVPISDSRTQYHIKMFERQLASWKAKTRGLVPDVLLDQYEAVTSLYIHEIALHTEHNVDDFRPVHPKFFEQDQQHGPHGDGASQPTQQPYQNQQYSQDKSGLSSPSRSNPNRYDPNATSIASIQDIRSLNTNPAGPSLDVMTTAHIEALTECVDSITRTMTSFGQLPQSLLRGLPGLHMVWVAYAAVVMIRLHGMLKSSWSVAAAVQSEVRAGRGSQGGHASSSSTTASPSGGIEKDVPSMAEMFLKRMDVVGCLDICLRRIERVATETEASPAESFLIVFRKLKAWFIIRNGSGPPGAGTGTAGADPSQSQGPGRGQSWRTADGSAPVSDLDDRYGANPQSITDTSDTAPYPKHGRTAPSPRGADGSTEMAQVAPGGPGALNQDYLLPHQQMHARELMGRAVENTHSPTDMNAHLRPATTAFFDPNPSLDVSAFDVGTWGLDMSMNELNNFDNYMYDVGWMGHLM